MGLNERGSRRLWFVSYLWVAPCKTKLALLCCSVGMSTARSAAAERAPSFPVSIRMEIVTGELETLGQSMKSAGASSRSD